MAQAMEPQLDALHSLNSSLPLAELAADVSAYVCDAVHAWQNNLLSCADCVWRSHTCLCIPVCGPCTYLHPTSHQLHIHTLPLSLTSAQHTRTHTHSNSTLSWFINEQIARGDGKRRLDDLRVIEVDAREDEKCVCACVLCLCAFEGRIEANGWDGEKWDWTSREISIRAACVPSCPWEGVRPRAGRWTAQRTAVLLCLIKPMLRISSRPPHLSSSSSQSAVNLRVRAAAFLRMSACCEFSTLISWRPPTTPVVTPRTG